MRRFWPISFLTLLAVAILGRQEPQPVFPQKPVRAFPAQASAPLQEPERPAPQVSADLPSSPIPKEPDVHRYSWRTDITLSALYRLSLDQNGDGSWGDVPEYSEGQCIGRPGLTALALLSYFEGGYSHLSADIYDGQNFGVVVGHGLDWLLENQRDDGTFQSGTDSPLDQSLAAYALNEAFGRTESSRFKDPARKAADAVLRSQNSDGSWGGPGPTAWAIHTLWSAADNQFLTADEAKERTLRAAGGEPHPNDLYRALVVTRNRAAFEDRISAIIASPPSPQDLAAWYHASRTVLLFAGRHSETWNRWAVPLKAAITGGTWPGATRSQTILQSSLALLTQQTHHYHHPATFGPPAR